MVKHRILHAHFRDHVTLAEVQDVMGSNDLIERVLPNKGGHGSVCAVCMQVGHGICTGVKQGEGRGGGVSKHTLYIQYIQHENISPFPHVATMALYHGHKKLCIPDRTNRDKLGKV